MRGQKAECDCRSCLFFGEELDCRSERPSYAKIRLGWTWRLDDVAFFRHSSVDQNWRKHDWRLTAEFSGGTPPFQHAGAPALGCALARPPAAEHFMRPRPLQRFVRRHWRSALHFPAKRLTTWLIAGGRIPRISRARSVLRSPGVSNSRSSTASMIPQFERSSHPLPPQ